jgi:hypothetical protein
MRLLHVQNIQLKSFETSDAPPFAILSHTWGENEVTFQDLTSAAAPFPRRGGWAKILGACRKARAARFEWIWIDTCCIDKTSSAELSEAINSMFRYYERSKVCYAYLDDVTTTQAANSGQLQSILRPARWFKRGWTLQELIAPPEVEFCSADWKTFGTRSMLSELISNITRIDRSVLAGEKELVHVSIAQRMSWAAERRTSREEDIAYCLMGIFGVNMPLLYGEGSKAFVRLQEEIVKESEDQSIFVWEYVDLRMMTNKGIFAEHPKAFQTSFNVVPSPSKSEPLSITNRGLRTHAPILKDYNGCQFVLALYCHRIDEEHSDDQSLGIPLQRVSQIQTKFYRDTSQPIQLISATTILQSINLTIESIFVQKFGLAGDLPPLTRSVFLGLYPYSFFSLTEAMYIEKEQSVSRFSEVRKFKNEKITLKTVGSTACFVFSFRRAQWQVSRPDFKVVLLIRPQTGAEVYINSSEETVYKILDQAAEDGFVGDPVRVTEIGGFKVAAREVASATEHSYVVYFSDERLFIDI